MLFSNSVYPMKRYTIAAFQARKTTTKAASQLGQLLSRRPRRVHQRQEGCVTRRSGAAVQDRMSSLPRKRRPSLTMAWQRQALYHKGRRGYFCCRLLKKVKGTGGYHAQHNRPPPTLSLSVSSCVGSDMVVWLLSMTLTSQK